MVALLGGGCDLTGTDPASEPQTTGPSTSGEVANSTGEASSTGEAGESTHAPDCTETESAGEENSTGEPSDTPPMVAVTMPATDLLGDDGVVYDEFDEELGLWYADVELGALATDAEDGDLSAQVVWTTDQSALQDVELGTGATATVRLYSDECFGAVHSITATVTDSDGNVAAAEPRQINIWTLC